MPLDALLEAVSSMGTHINTKYPIEQCISNALTMSEVINGYNDVLKQRTKAQNMLQKLPLVFLNPFIYFVEKKSYDMLLTAKLHYCFTLMFVVSMGRISKQGSLFSVAKLLLSRCCRSSSSCWKKSDSTYI